MPGLRINISVKSDTARAAVRQLHNIGDDPAPLLDLLGSHMADSVRDNFDREATPEGTPWAQSERAKREGGRTLFNHGLLYDSIRYAVHPGSVEIGVDGASESAKYSYVHHYGATIVPKRARVLAFPGPDGHMIFAKRVVIPARRFLGIKPTDPEDVAQAWMDYVRSRLG